jgi:alpha-galactosidase/6-phospho-beta-glucosidase family protein
VTDQDVRRQMADEIASELQTRAEEINFRSRGLPHEEWLLHVGMARGLERAAELGRRSE